jgi:hypothetical protein
LELDEDVPAALEKVGPEASIDGENNSCNHWVFEESNFTERWNQLKSEAFFRSGISSVQAAQGYL